MLKIVCAMLWMSVGMSCSSSGGKPLTTRRHINENKRLETSSEVSYEGESEKGTKNLGNAQSSVSRRGVCGIRGRQHGSM